MFPSSLRAYELAWMSRGNQFPEDPQLVADMSWEGFRPSDTHAHARYRPAAFRIRSCLRAVIAPMQSASGRRFEGRPADAAERGYLPVAARVFAEFLTFSVFCDPSGRLPAGITVAVAAVDCIFLGASFGSVVDFFIQYPHSIGFPVEPLRDQIYLINRLNSVAVQGSEKKFTEQGLYNNLFIRFCQGSNIKKYGLFKRKSTPIPLECVKVGHFG